MNTNVPDLTRIKTSTHTEAPTDEEHPHTRDARTHSRTPAPKDAPTGHGQPNVPAAPSAREWEGQGDAPTRPPAGRRRTRLPRATARKERVPESARATRLFGRLLFGTRRAVALGRMGRRSARSLVGGAFSHPCASHPREVGAAVTAILQAAVISERPA